MAIFPSSALLLAALLQGKPPAPGDSLAALRVRVTQGSTEGRGWLQLGRAYLRLSDEYHAHRVSQDTAWVRAVLDTAEDAFGRAVLLFGQGGAGAEADTARVGRVRVWGERSLLAWELAGLGTGPQAWGPLPEDLRLSPVLEELGENLLRACPNEGVLLTANDADSYAAWFMRFARGLRPDLLIVRLAVWRADSVFRARAARDLKLGGRPGEDGWLAALADRRPVCVSMGFDRPPETRPRIKWSARPLLWVAGPHLKDDRVPPRDFVFAALKMALERRETWAQPALALYARAARTTPALCAPLATFRLREDVGCRK